MSKLNQVLLDWKAGDVHGLRLRIFPSFLDCLKILQAM